MSSTLFAMFGMPGPMEMLIILAIFLLLFGSNRLPSLMRNLGSSAREFKKGVQGMEEELDEATRKLKDEDAEQGVLRARGTGHQGLQSSAPC